MDFEETDWEKQLNSLTNKKNVYQGEYFDDEDWYHVFSNGEPFDYKPSLKVRNHSPTGFSWGYGGSGPAQLALAILLEETNKEIAEQFYMDFKWDVIARLPNELGTSWTLTSDMILNWLEGKLKTKVEI